MITAAIHAPIATRVFATDATATAIACGFVGAVRSILATLMEVVLLIVRSLSFLAIGQLAQSATKMGAATIMTISEEQGRQ